MVDCASAGQLPVVVAGVGQTGTRGSGRSWTNRYTWQWQELDKQVHVSVAGAGRTNSYMWQWQELDKQVHVAVAGVGQTGTLAVAGVGWTDKQVHMAMQGRGRTDIRKVLLFMLTVA